MKKLTVLISLVLVWSVVAFPAKSADSSMASQVDIPFEKFVLPNGLTLIVHEDHKAPIVGVNVWYHVGSKNEKPGRTGFAHLFEHLMFNGTEHWPGEFFEPPGGGRRHRHERHHQRRSHQLLRERPHERAGSGPVAGVGPHGPHAGGHYQEKLDEQRAWSRTRSARGRINRTAGPGLF